jgi:hypothetical protein
MINKRGECTDEKDSSIRRVHRKQKNKRRRSRGRTAADSSRRYLEAGPNEYM